MDTMFIKNVNRHLRNNRPYFPKDKFCEVFKNGNLLEISFLSKQCKNDRSGSCLMCDYGRTDKVGPNEIYLGTMDKILSEESESIDFLLLCSNGSILDEYQISTQLLTEILKKAQNCKIPKIIIETHYKDVTKDRLNLIKSIIHKPVTIEMGLETINPVYQSAFFMKGIDIGSYEKTVELIHSYNFDVELNIMLGLPFMSASEQVEDVKKTIKWAIERNCTPVVFPINIKAHTMLRYLYENKLYSPISLWLLVHLLDSVEPTVLEKIIIAWYGNRDESYTPDIPTIHPECCNDCKENLMAFGRKFLDLEDGFARKKLIQTLKKTISCDCYKNLIQKLNCSESNFETNYKKFYVILQRDFRHLIYEETKND